MASDSTVTCPHCMNAVPWGARVCRGCHAEITYGTPRGVAILFTVLCVIVGWYVTKLVHDNLSTNSTLLWTVFGVVFLICALVFGRGCTRFYAGKTMFRRFYRK